MTRQRTTGRRRSVLAGWTLCAALVATGAGATVLVPADLADLSRGAQAIARGRVAALDTRWNENRRGVETLVTLEVESYLKGALGRALTFRVPGGRLGRYRSLVVGAPDFAVGERVVVFLGYAGPGIPYVLGLSQGVYRVTQRDDGAAGGVVTPLVVESLPGAAAPQRLVRGDPARRPLDLETFERRVRTLAEGAR